MGRKLATLVVLLILFAGTASAQTAEARKTLEAAVKVMGATNLKTIQYTASGWFSQIGQTYGLAEDWPHYEVTDYARVIDYDAKWSREDYTRRHGKYPTLGRPPMPEQHVTSILSGTMLGTCKATCPYPSRGCIWTACLTPICGNWRSC
jgi:hypothetical protein